MCTPFTPGEQNLGAMRDVCWMLPYTLYSPFFPPLAPLSSLTLCTRTACITWAEKNTHKTAFIYVILFIYRFTPLRGPPLPSQTPPRGAVPSAPCSHNARRHNTAPRDRGAQDGGSQRLPAAARRAGGNRGGTGTGTRPRGRAGGVEGSRGGRRGLVRGGGALPALQHHPPPPHLR